MAVFLWATIGNLSLHERCRFRIVLAALRAIHSTSPIPKRELCSRSRPKKEKSPFGVIVFFGRLSGIGPEMRAPQAPVLPLHHSRHVFSEH